MRFSQLWLFLWIFVAFAVSQEATELLDKGKESLNTGAYDMAQQHLEKAVEKTEAARVPLLHLYRLIGEYDKALAMSDKIAEGKEKGYGKMLRGEILMDLGRYDEARESFLDAYQLLPDSIAVQGNLGLYYFTRGQRDKYLSYFSRLFDKYKVANKYTPEELVHLSRASYIYCMKSDEVDRDNTLEILVQKMLPRAIQEDKYCFEAYRLQADILLDAFNSSGAGNAIKEAMELNAHHPALLVAQAICQTQKFGDRSQVIPTLQHALRINPKLIEALNLEAAIYLSDEEYDKAEAVLERTLASNANHLPTLSLMAAFYYMRGRNTAYESTCQKVLAINPIYGDLYLTLANMIICKRQFSDAAAFSRRAIELDPFLWHAYMELGANLMRLGQEKEAEKYLRKLWDEYSLHTQSNNTLKLLNKYQEFKVFDIPNFKIRLHVSEAETMLPLVSELLQQAYTTLSQKYQFKPEGTILFELFPEHNDFSVRTIGLESLGATGACFGQVVVEVSPRAGLREMNWASVAWHEFTHVITLQLTNYQVPRWFTEGLSEFAEHERNASCHRALDLELYSAYCSGMLRGMADLNAGFTRPKYGQEIVVCYYQAGLIVQFIAETKGFDKILEMLKLYRQEKKDSEVIKTVFGMTLKEFDDVFLAWLKASVFDHMAVFPGIDPHEIADLQDQLFEDANNVEACRRLSLGYLQQGRYRDSEIYASKLLTLAPQDAATYDILGYLAFHQHNMKQAQKVLEKAVELGSRNFYTHSVLGDLYAQQKKFDKAVRAYETAKTSFPAYVRPDNPYEKLAKLYVALGQREKAWGEMEAYLAREGYDFPNRLRLGEEFVKHKKYDKALRLLLEARDINPFEVKLHMLLAQAQRARKEWQNAKFSYLLALTLTPVKEKPPLYVEVAEMCFELKQFDEARQYVEKALTQRPDDKRAQDLLHKLPK
jgi:tetratricopeptide (TPR) repeat protein